MLVSCMLYYALFRADAKQSKQTPEHSLRNIFSGLFEGEFPHFFMTNYQFVIASRCKKDSTTIRLPESLRHEAGLKAGDHITISIDGERMTITKDLQCRVCQRYTNQLFSKAVQAADDNMYYSLAHCSACRDIPDYSKKRI